MEPGDAGSDDSTGRSDVDDRDDEWTRRATLVAADDGEDRFGVAVAVSGDGTTAIVGVPGERDRPGSAHVFAGSRGGDDGTGLSLPGPGTAGGVVGLAGGAYWLRRRAEDDRSGE